jgi:hypothetical protein
VVDFPELQDPVAVPVEVLEEARDALCGPSCSPVTDLAPCGLLTDGWIGEEMGGGGMRLLRLCAKVVPLLRRVP